MVTLTTLRSTRQIIEPSWEDLVDAFNNVKRPGEPLRADWLAYVGSEDFGIWLFDMYGRGTDEARAAFCLVAAKAVEKVGIPPIPIPKPLQYDPQWSLYCRLEEEMALREGKTIDLSDAVPLGLGEVDKDAVDPCTRAWLELLRRESSAFRLSERGTFTMQGKSYPSLGGHISDVCVASAVYCMRRARDEIGTRLVNNTGLTGRTLAKNTANSPEAIAVPPASRLVAQEYQRRDEAAEDAIKIFESHHDFARVQVRMRERMEQATRNLPTDARTFGSKARLEHVLSLFDIRAEAFLELVSDIRSQNALMVVLESFGRVVWEEYTGWPLEVMRPASAKADAVLSKIHAKVQRWTYEGYKRLANLTAEPAQVQSVTDLSGHVPLPTPRLTMPDEVPNARDAQNTTSFEAEHCEKSEGSPEARANTAAVLSPERRMDSGATGNKRVDLLRRIVAKKTITVETWAAEHKFGRTTVYDWKAARLTGKSLKGKVSDPKIAQIERAIEDDGKALGLTTRTHDSD
jgi:hypothetical protein